jgi:hypothetical protein
MTATAGRLSWVCPHLRLQQQLTIHTRRTARLRTRLRSQLLLRLRAHAARWAARRRPCGPSRPPTAAAAPATRATAATAAGPERPRRPRSRAAVPTAMAAVAAAATAAAAAAAATAAARQTPAQPHSPPRQAPQQPGAGAARERAQARTRPAVRHAWHRAEGPDLRCLPSAWCPSRAAEPPRPAQTQNNRFNAAKKKWIAATRQGRFASERNCAAHY